MFSAFAAGFLCGALSMLVLVVLIGRNSEPTRDDSEERRARGEFLNQVNDKN